MNPEEEVIETEPVEPEEVPEIEIPLEDVVFEDENFVDPTPEDLIDKQDIIIYLQQEEIKSLNEKHDAMMESNQKVIDNLQLLINQGETGSTTIGDGESQIITKLENMLELQNEFVVGNNTLITYGTVYIPFLVICVLLWRFFATFLRSAR